MRLKKEKYNAHQTSSEKLIFESKGFPSSVVLNGLNRVFTFCGVWYNN